MRIGIVIAELVREGGGERQALQLAKELVDLGHDVVVHTAERSPDCYRELASRLQIRVSGRHPLSRLPLPGRVRLFLDMRRLAGSIRGEFDVLNPHAWPAHWAAVAAARRGRRTVPVVWMCNEYMWQDGPPPFAPISEKLKSHLRRAIRRYDQARVEALQRVVCLSRLAKQVIAGGYGADATVVHSGSDGDRFAGTGDGRVVRERLGIGEGRFLLLFLGILMPHRRIEDLLQAVTQLLDRGHREVKLVVAGSLKYDPEYAEHLQQLARELELRDHVVFAGPVNEEELPDWYRACDAFVFPCEGQTWSLATTEAMAAGAPVLVSTGVGLAEVLTDGENAMLFPPRRPDVLAKQVATLIDDPATRRAIGEAGQALARSYLTYRRYAIDMLGVFEETASAPALHRAEAA